MDELVLRLRPKGNKAGVVHRHFCVCSASAFYFEKNILQKTNICSIMNLRYLSRKNSCLTSQEEVQVWKVSTFTLPVLAVRTSDCLI